MCGRMTLYHFRYMTLAMPCEASIDCEAEMTEPEITRGSGNVFVDLDLPEPAERQTKTRLALALNRIIKARGLKQAESALLLGVPQPKVSALVNYRLDGFSVEKLMDFIVTLGRDVEIVVRPVCGDGEARVSVLEVV